MIRQFFATIRERLRRLRRLRHEQQMSGADAAALTGQAAPDAGRVLVLRPDSIGDYLLFRPWLRVLSEAVRGQGRQRLTLAANALWAPLAQAWDADLFDELLPLEVGRFQRDLPYRAGVLRQLGAAGFGTVLYPPHVREPAIENFIRFLAAPQRVASVGEGHQEPWYRLVNAGYTRLLPARPGVLFEYERNGEFAAAWLDCAVPMPPLALPAAVHAAGVAEAAGGRYVVLFPGASASQKQWPAARFGQLARALHQAQPALRLVVAGSPADAPLARELARAAGADVPLDDRCGRTDLPGLAALLAGAVLVVSNDTVAAHLAVQAAVPTLVLLMGENYGKFFPYPPGLLRAPCQCLFPPSQEARLARGDTSRPPHDPDLTTLEPARVLAAALALLGGPPATG